MFGKIKAEFQCLEGYGQNSNAWRDKTGNPIFERRRREFQCLEEFQCFEG